MLVGLDSSDSYISRHRNEQGRRELVCIFYRHLCKFNVIQIRWAMTDVIRPELRLTEKHCVMVTELKLGSKSMESGDMLGLELGGGQRQPLQAEK